MLQVHSEVLATALAGLQKTERGMSQRRESQDVNRPLCLDKDGDVLETRNRNKFHAEPAVSWGRKGEDAIDFLLLL